ncbi:internalin-A [Kordia sp. SMS9]|uniref:leucine-rich repeat domain-containing protein n=1 Tax=Kordia sp. SMS9 TaxID=2282170 RepID=UPI000E0D3CDD|nr:leucine-rich repeat domain-containing protein [Kordia sp. SMS9]AXG72222.1 internalin-A [Kordia sp. SMS9]
MKKKLLATISVLIVCFGMLKTNAQELEGGGGFTVDGTFYEVINFNPDEVAISSSAPITGQYTIPSSVTFQDVTYTVVEIYFEAFANNTDLTSVTIPSTIRFIDNQAFVNTGLTEVIALGNTPATVFGDSFGTPSNIDLIVPSIAIDDYLNNGWTGFATVNGTLNLFEVNNITYGINSQAGNTVSVISSTLTGSITIPSSVTFNTTNFTVTKIANYAFLNAQLTSVSLPNTITEIGIEAFRGNQLTSIALPSALATIKNAAFRDNQLADVLLPNTVTSMEERAFFDNQITSITFSTGLTTISRSAFSSNNLTSISIPDGITVIDDFAFQANNIADITIPASVTTIDGFAFFNNPITTVAVLATTPPTVGNIEFTFDTPASIALTVPSGTETAYENAGWTGFASVNGVVALIVGSTFTENNFDYEITSLSPNEVAIKGGTNIPQDLIIDASVTTQGTTFSVVRVGQSAFENTNLTSVQLPNTLRNIDNFAFQSNQLTSLTIPSSVRVISFRAFRLNQIGGDLVIPNTITSLGNGAFETNNLASVTISENISTIPAQAFRNNQLTTVTIPANVNSLGNNCFRNNPLTEVIVLNTTPPSITGGSNSDSFQGSRGNIALIVPTNTELNYLTSGWTGFATINGQDPAVFNEFDDTNITFRIRTLTPNTVEIVDSSITGELIIPTSANNGTENFAITAIVADALRNNQLTSVVVPPSITSIGRRAFQNNPLKTFILEGFTPPSLNNQTNGNNTFTNRSTINLFVRSGNVQPYTNAGWTGFKSITGASKALALKVYLQGASLNPNTGEEDVMRDDLRAAGLLPFISPYGDGLAIFDTILVNTTTGSDAIVDWVFVELRDPLDNTIIIESRSALLQRDGDIVGMDAVSPIQFAANVGDYFIAIKHRNHLGIMMANAKRLSSVITIIDFANAINPITFGINAQTDAGMPANTLGMWAGNVNGDSIVQYQGGTPDTTAILSAALNDPGNFLNFSTFIINGYNDNDVNLSGTTQYEGGVADSPLILQNVLAHPGNFLNFSTFQIEEQLPTQD